MVSCGTSYTRIRLRPPSCSMWFHCSSWLTWRQAIVSRSSVQSSALSSNPVASLSVSCVCRTQSRTVSLRWSPWLSTEANQLLRTQPQLIPSSLPCLLRCRSHRSATFICFICPSRKTTSPAHSASISICSGSSGIFSPLSSAQSFPQSRTSLRRFLLAWYSSPLFHPSFAQFFSLCSSHVSVASTPPSAFPKKTKGAFPFTRMVRIQVQNRSIFSTTFDVHLFLMLPSSFFTSWRSPCLFFAKENEKICQNLAMCFASEYTSE